MKNSLKGALLSGLIFPGLGHLALKRYPRGIVLVLTATTSMVVIVVEAIRRAFAILEKIEAEGGQITMETITAAANQVTATSGNLILNAGLIFLVLCWIFGVVDAYQIGKSIDAQE